MTREEAIKAISDMILDMEYPNGVYHEKFTEDESQKHLALYAVKKALRPVSREQVEKVWRGKWIHAMPILGSGDEEIRCSKCGNIVGFETDFCPNCGARMDKEAEQ